MIEALENRAVAASRACARAEFAKWSAVLSLREALIDRIEAEGSSMFKRMAINATALEVGQLLHLSEQQVWRITEQSSRLRDQVPTAWAAFAAGDVDLQKASVIAVAVGRLKQPESMAALDAKVVAYAASHTAAELRRWVNEIIDHLEPITEDEADAEYATRSVSVEHGRDGMSHIIAKVGTAAAVAIMKRLREAAKTITDDPDTEPRTREQKMADLFVSWLTNATGTESDIKAEVAIVIDAKALAGVTDTPAHVIDIDDNPPIPAAWVLGLDPDSTLWTRLLTDAAGQVLDVTHLGYQPPEALRKAIAWRDMTCRVSGCHHRADQSDLDHRIPFDAGCRTSGSNLQSLCRRHHGMKGHGLLPADAYDPPAVHLTRLPTPPIIVEYVAA